MIAYTTFGTNDIAKSQKFYDALFSGLGIERLMGNEYFTVWGKSFDQPSFGITLPFDKKPATAGNGTMVALAMESTKQVDEMYAKAISLGATDEGPAGLRESGFYAGYVRDPDGNKLNFFHMPPPPA